MGGFYGAKIKSYSTIPLKYVSKEGHINEELFNAASVGDFESAKVLIELAHLNVNLIKIVKLSSSSCQVRKRCSEPIETVLLEELLEPNTPGGLDKYIDFVSFVVSKGYK